MNENFYKLIQFVIKNKIKILVPIFLTIFGFLFFIYLIPPKPTASFSITIPSFDNKFIYKDDDFIEYLRSELFYNSIILDLNYDKDKNDKLLTIKAALNRASFNRTGSQILFKVSGLNEDELISISNNLATTIVDKFNQTYSIHLISNSESLARIINLIDYLHNYYFFNNALTPGSSLVGISELEAYYTLLLAKNFNSYPSYIYSKPTINYQLFYTNLFLKLIFLILMSVILSILFFSKNHIISLFK